MADPLDVRYRLLRLMKLRDHAKAAEVDKVMLKWKGKEDLLLKNSIRKYGSEPPPEPFDLRVSRFFKSYDTDGLSTVDNLINSYKGRENECIVHLVQKYGPEPDPPTPRGGPSAAAPQVTTTATAASTSQAQPKPQSVPQHIEVAAADASMIAKQKERLARFYLFYNVQKSDEDIDIAVKKYAQSAGGFDDMWKSLKVKYGPEPADSTGQRERLRAFWAYYAAPKTDADVDSTIRHFAVSEGGFKKMWTGLEQKYGPESAVTGTTMATSKQGPLQPAASVPQAAVSSQSPTKNASQKQSQVKSAPQKASPKGTQRDRLIRFYAHYAPTKTEADIDTALQKFEGDYDTMWRQLETKYGPEASIPWVSSTGAPAKPPASARGDVDPREFASQKSRLINYYAQYVPGKTEADIDKALQMYSSAPGGFERMWTTLINKYGPELPEENAPQSWMGPEDKKQRDRLKRFYALYAPEKSENDIDIALKRYAQSQGGYAAMWSALETKYGPEPKVPQSATQAAPGQLSHKERLMRFYARYAPEKTEADVDLALCKYANVPRGYTQMWETIQQKYGPEEPLPHEQQTIQPQPPQFDYPTVGSPATLIDDADAMASGMSRSTRIGGLPGHEGQASWGTAVDILHIIIKFFGADFGFYEHSPTDKRHRFRETIEMEVARNMAIPLRQVKLTRLTAGSINVELDVELPSGDDPQAHSDALVGKVQSGRFIVANIRDSYRRDLGGNPIQLYAQTCTVLGPHGTPESRVAFATARKTDDSMSHPLFEVPPVPIVPSLTQTLRLQSKGPSLGKPDSPDFSPPPHGGPMATAPQQPMRNPISALAFPSRESSSSPHRQANYQQQQAFQHPGSYDLSASQYYNKWNTPTAPAASSMEQLGFLTSLWQKPNQRESAANELTAAGSDPDSLRSQWRAIRTPHDRSSSQHSRGSAPEYINISALLPPSLRGADESTFFSDLPPQPRGPSGEGYAGGAPNWPASNFSSPPIARTGPFASGESPYGLRGGYPIPPHIASAQQQAGRSEAYSEFSPPTRGMVTPQMPSGSNRIGRPDRSFASPYFGSAAGQQQDPYLLDIVGALNKYH